MISQVPIPGFIGAVWPQLSPNDSPLQRRQKTAVRWGQLAVALMVGAALGGTMLTVSRTSQVIWLLGAGLLYILISLHAIRDAIGAMLSPKGSLPARLTAPRVRARAVFSILAQLGLALWIYSGCDNPQVSGMLWLILLPPVGHSVILLRWPGITLVCLASMGILLVNALRCYGTWFVPYATLEFTFALLFTLVFTLLAASSEKSRHEVLCLAGALTEANRQLREYAIQAEELAATRERNRLAREIHDSLGHFLTVINVQIEAALSLEPSEPARSRSALMKAQRLTQEGLQEIRCSVAALRSLPLDHKPLVEALRQLVEDSRAAGLATEMEILGAIRPNPPQAGLTFYRAAQEGLTNARKHGAATQVHLTLDYQSASLVKLIINDNGKGATNPIDTASGFGLLGLRERALLLGGEVRIQTSPQGGFTLELEIPA